MSLAALQEYTFVSKYARFVPEKNRRETWVEAVERVRDMHIRKYPQIKEDIEWAFDQVKQKRVLGSQRAMQFGGKPIEKINARLYNCTASYCDRIRFFQEAFWMLLCGTGVGFSVQKHHVAKLPNFTDKKKGTKIFIIPDSIEGWADSLGVLLASYFYSEEFPEFEGYKVQFNYSLIRPEGSPLGSSSGKAPGPKPLKIALEKVVELLDNCIVNKQTNLRPIDAYDILMHISDAVLSGGVRRSATLALFSPDDKEMATAKTGNWFAENPQRGRSNNSALLLRNETTKEQFEELMGYVREFGEPGFIWSDSTECLFNPCVEVALYGYDENGNSGWQTCNLAEINGRKCKTPEDFETASRAAAIIGTCQAGYTDFNYLGSVTESIVRKEALLGVSITGMMDNPDILFDPKLQRKNAKLILEVNKDIASKIGINPTARATCLKPSGTTSCILGTASGIHPHHASKYIRRSQGNYLEPPLQYFKGINPIAIEKSVWSANGTDEVIAFCIEVPVSAKTKNDIDALTLLDYVKITQQNWVMAGTDKELCVQKWLNHNVSNTISVREDEWDDVSEYIYRNRKYFAGISLLPITGDKDYPQAPFTAIYTPLQLVKMYGDASVMASGLIVDGLHIFDNNLWAACDAVSGFGSPIIKPTEIETKHIDLDEIREYKKQLKLYEDKQDWIRRAKQFAERYFDNDVKKMTYCLKDVSNWHYWCNLQREYKNVDFSLMVENQDNTKSALLESACSGGSCTLEYV